MSFWQAKTKIRRTDSLFSKFIRTRDKWKCQYKFKCTGQIDFTDNPFGLTCSHFIKRRQENVRFSPENCDSCCRPCHAFVEDKVEGKKMLEEWKLKQLGKKEYSLLLFRGQSYKKRDDAYDLLLLKALMGKPLGRAKLPPPHSH